MRRRCARSAAVRPRLGAVQLGRHLAVVDTLVVALLLRRSLTVRVAAARVSPVADSAPDPPPAHASPICTASNARHATKSGALHQVPYLSASGLLGEPVPPVTLSGGAQIKRSAPIWSPTAPPVLAFQASCIARELLAIASPPRCRDTLANAVPGSQTTSAGDLLPYGYRTGPPWPAPPICLPSVQPLALDMKDLAAVLAVDGIGIVAHEPAIGALELHLVGRNSVCANRMNNETPKIMINTASRRPAVSSIVMSPKPVVVSVVTEIEGIGVVSDLRLRRTAWRAPAPS